MGLLSYFQQQDPYAGTPFRRVGQQQTPFAPAPQQGQLPGPAMTMPPAPQIGGFMGGQAQPQPQRQGGFQRFTQALEGLPNNSLFNMGLSLLGNAQGGDWSQVSQDMQAFGARQQEQKRLTNEERRAEALARQQGQAFTQQQELWRREADEYEAYLQHVQGVSDPVERQRLLAMGQDGWAQYTTQQDEMKWREEQAALDRAAQLRAAGIAAYGRSAANRPEGASPGYVRPNGRDSMMMEDFASATDSARALLNVDIPRLRDLFGRMIERDAAGNPLPSSVRMTVARYLQLHPEERAAWNQIESAIWPLVQQRLEGLAPITQFELGQAIHRTPSADWHPAAIMEELDNMERAAQLTIDLGTSAYDFQGQAGSFTGGGRNAQGQSWLDYSGPIYARHRYVPPDQQGGAPAPSRPQLRDPASVQLGTEARNDQGEVVYSILTPDGRRVWATEAEVWEMWGNRSGYRAPSPANRRPPGRNR